MIRHCTGCKGNIHRTTKICPHCGGDFEAIFGPNRGWGTAPTPEQIRKAKEQEKEWFMNAPTWEKVLIVIISIPIFYFCNWLVSGLWSGF